MQILKKHAHSEARITRISTAHGDFLTPTFMPVATRAAINLMSAHDLKKSRSQIILGGNTYHMLCAPGMEIIQQAGGMHALMGWHGPMLTDSGGFQVFSLSQNKKICTIDDGGAHFRHPKTRESIYLTPEKSIQAQKIIGADIIMAFDQCTPDTDDRDVVQKAMARTHRWLIQSKEAHDRHPHSMYGYPQIFFGIIQGAFFKELRQESTEAVLAANVDGIAIGGESIGFDMAKTGDIIQWVRPLLPENKTRYTMGVGLHPQNLIDVIECGIDIFDCVAPTRNARHGSLYAGKIIKRGQSLYFDSEDGHGRILIKKNQYARDFSPIMEECVCDTCQNYTRAYLHYLFKENLMLYYNLACIHNVSVMHQICEKMREVIVDYNASSIQCRP